MFKRILLAYEGSPETDAALSQAAELALLCKAELHLLGVCAATGTAALLQMDAPPELFAVGREQVQEALTSAANDLGKRGLSVNTFIREGIPAIEIAAHANEINADLAILGHTTKGFIARWLIGSTGADLIRHLPCSLLISADS